MTTAEQNLALNNRLVDLLSRCALHDAAAFKALYDAVSSQLFASLLRILKRKDLAEDALQEVMLSVWHNAGSYRTDRGRPMTWLTSIARYRALDMLRRQRPETQYEDEFVEGLRVSRDETITRAESAAERQRLEECMNDLSREQSTSIRLAYFDGCTHREISARLSAPLGTAKSWIRRGLQALKDCLTR
ncbi:sigma-70 family RNA polymerase sigma factor [soil metagenome]